MALVVADNILIFPTALPDARYRVVKYTGVYPNVVESEIAVGEVAVDATGAFSIDMEGKGVGEGEGVRANIHNYNTVDVADGACMDASFLVTDDGIIPPPVVERNLLRFDGSDTFVEFPESSIDFINGDFTVEFTATDLYTSDGTVCSQGLTMSQSSRLFQVYKFANTASVSMLIGGSITAFADCATDGTHVYKIVVTGTRCQFFVGGVEILERSVQRGSNTEVGGTFKIGTRSNGDNSNVTFTYPNFIFNFSLSDEIIATLIEGDGVTSALNTGTGANGTYRNVNIVDWDFGKYEQTAGFDIDYVAMFGASIVAQSFVNEPYTARLYGAKGNSVVVENHGVSGEDTAMMLARLPSFIAGYAGKELKTLVNIHASGNDITDNGPYPGGSLDIDTNLRQIIADLKAAGFIVALSTVTYRVPPASNPSEPYNTNIITPIINDVADLGFDWYTLSLVNTAVWHEIDGVHPTTAGEEMNRVDVVNTNSPSLKNWILTLV